MIHDLWGPTLGWKLLFIEEARSDRAFSTRDAAMDSALIDPVQFEKKKKKHNANNT